MSDDIHLSELQGMIDDCLEGNLSDENTARLSALLEHSAEARVHYWDAALIHGLLEHVIQNASLRGIAGDIAIREWLVQLYTMPAQFPR